MSARNIRAAPARLRDAPSGEWLIIRVEFVTPGLPVKLLP
jgi:hypothetical protein